jgi:hypothetical protein
MKRATHSQGSPPLKRRSSFMFSIRTVVEDDDAKDDLNNHRDAEPLSQRGLPPTSNIQESLVAPSEPETALHVPVTEDNSACTDDDGFNFDEDSIPEVVCSTAKKCCLVKVKLEESDGDLRTGIVAESGSKHVDRQNRFHEERPLRVTSVMEALDKSEDDLHGRCCILGDAASDSAKSFLDHDEDYLRVHLPGYMQR